MAEDYEQLQMALRRLLQAKTRKPGTLVRITQQTLVMMCGVIKDTLRMDSSLLHLSQPINVVGSMHGQFFDLLRIFDKIGHPPEHKYLFLGNYIDNGPQGIETIALLFIYKIFYPESIFLLRGNHEFAEVNETHGFQAECDARYSRRMWNAFNDAFDYLPIGAIIGEKLFAIHAGISPEAMTVDMIASVERPLKTMSSFITDLMWSDPDPDVEQFTPNENGASYLYGSDQVQDFLDENHLEVIVRSHQIAPSGFYFPFEPDRCLVSIYSAPNGIPGEETNGAIMIVDDNLSCSFSILKPMERRSEKKGNDRDVDSVFNPRASLSRTLKSGK